jgi:hypothetical protein
VYADCVDQHLKGHPQAVVAAGFATVPRLSAGYSWGALWAAGVLMFDF